MGKFLKDNQPLLTVMLQCQTPEVAIRRIRNANCVGAEAYGLQVESLLPEHRTPEVYRRLIKETGGRPVYVTNYRRKRQPEATDQQLADGLIEIAQCGATLCDVMGDLYCPHPQELTEDPAAIKQQEELIEQLHRIGAEVLMSSHVLKFTPAERVLEIARAQLSRGADIVKIVTGADTMQQQIENLRITDLLKQELGAPFLFLSGGTSSLHRRLGMKLGCCMGLCVYEHDHLSTKAQPLLQTLKTVRDQIDF